MYAVILPIIGFFITIIMYKTIPYDGEFALLIYLGFFASIVSGIILGLVTDKMSSQRKKTQLLILSFTIIILLNCWIFPFK